MDQQWDINGSELWETDCRCHFGCDTHWVKALVKHFMGKFTHIYLYRWRHFFSHQNRIGGCFSSSSIVPVIYLLNICLWTNLVSFRTIIKLKSSKKKHLIISVHGLFETCTFLVKYTIQLKPLQTSLFKSVLGIKKGDTVQPYLTPDAERHKCICSFQTDTVFWVPSTKLYRCNQKLFSDTNPPKISRKLVPGHFPEFADHIWRKAKGAWVKHAAGRTWRPLARPEPPADCPAVFSHVVILYR